MQSIFVIHQVPIHQSKTNKQKLAENKNKKKKQSIPIPTPFTMRVISTPHCDFRKSSSPSFAVTADFSFLSEVELARRIFALELLLTERGERWPLFSDFGSLFFRFLFSSSFSLVLERSLAPWGAFSTSASFSTVWW